MQITVKAFATFRAVMQNETSVDLPAGSTVADLLARLGILYPGLPPELFQEPGILWSYVNILQNGRNIVHLQGLATPLDDHDLIALFPPAAGG